MDRVIDERQGELIRDLSTGLLGERGDSVKRVSLALADAKGEH
jgi:hypothetical protein